VTLEKKATNMYCSRWLIQPKILLLRTTQVPTQGRDMASVECLALRQTMIWIK